MVTNIATTTQEDLHSWSKKLADNYHLIKKSRKKVIDTKDSIVNTQQYLRNRIMKHMRVLKACLKRREGILECDVDARTNKKLELLDAQERYEFVTGRCKVTCFLDQVKPLWGGKGYLVSGVQESANCWQGNCIRVKPIIITSDP